jgi:hypothetical protein
MTTESVHALSVRDLVRRRRGDDSDAWHLALVQRDEVWDQVRMRYLLDSLLNGYPIGSLLVCSVTGQSRVMRIETGQRVVTEADDQSWQLLDGQQRINALFSLFTPDAKYGHFYLHMTLPPATPAGPVTSRRGREQALRYIHWQEESGADRAIPDRDRYIDLSRFYGWAEGEQGSAIAGRATGHSKEETVAILNAIDPDFADHLEAEELDRASERLRQLLRAWNDPAIPVQHIGLGSPHDVLEIFTRLNRAGVQVAGQDLFFAAVKTYWNDAEAAIARVVKTLGPRETPMCPLIDRLGALRLTARLAARGLGQPDVVPLTVDRLTGPRGQALIVAMQTLSDAEGLPLRRMAAALHAVMEFSRLGFGLYSADPRLWDEVLAWAAVHPRAEEARWLAEQLPAIDSYLFGATAFNYPSVLRDPFARLAMTEAVAAGASGENFPTRRIAEVARAKMPDLHGGRQRIRAAQSEEDRLSLADANASLFLSVFQKIPYRPQRDVFDWDHIFPAAQASLMWTPGHEGRWRRHHPHRRFVASAGNFWGLSAGANRAAQDKLPRQKFEAIEGWRTDGTYPIWPRELWGLSDQEVQAFSEIGESLEAGLDIDAAMEGFRKLVTSRALRMVDEAFVQFPDAVLFAAAADLSPAEASPEPEIAATLGIPLPNEPEPSESAVRRPSAEERVQRVLRLADERGSGPAIRAFVELAARFGLQVRGYQWTLTLTPPKTRAFALVALGPQEQRGLVETWVSPAAFATHFQAVGSDRFDEALGGVRGAKLDAAELESLRNRLAELLSTSESGRALEASV